jgi:hypothetical protein
MKPRPTPPPETCPVCGAEVPPDAAACPGCGADEQTGWSAAAQADGLDLPDHEFDYERFVQEEFGGGPKRTPREWFWYVVALGVLLAFLLIYVVR